MTLSPSREPAGAMVELIRTTDPVLLSWLEMTFRQRGIKFVVFDAYTSTVYGGALDAIPRRVVVCEEDLPAALSALAEAEAGDANA